MSVPLTALALNEALLPQTKVVGSIIPSKITNQPPQIAKDFPIENILSQLTR